MFEDIKTLLSFYRRGKFSEMYEYAVRCKEAEKSLDMDGLVENYAKMIGCVANETKYKDGFEEFLEIYKPFIKKFLTLGKNHLENRITDSEFVSEFTSEFMNLPNSEKYDVSVSFSKGKEGLGLSWSIK